MIKVYYSKVSPFLEEDTFFSQLAKIPADRKEKILRMKNKEARMRSLTAGLLLQYMLCEETGLDYETAEPFQIRYGEKGKPYPARELSVHFSLSHSGDYVCCAIGDGPVGIDIQQKTEGKERLERLAERFFTCSEKRMLSECEKEQRRDLFFRMWSIKESYLKLTGEGLCGGLSSFEISWQEKKIIRKKNEPEAKSLADRDTTRARDMACTENEADAYFAETDQVQGYSFCVCAWEPLAGVCWKECNIGFGVD